MQKLTFLSTEELWLQYLDQSDPGRGERMETVTLHRPSVPDSLYFSVPGDSSPGTVNSHKLGISQQPVLSQIPDYLPLSL